MNQIRHEATKTRRNAMMEMGFNKTETTTFLESLWLCVRPGFESVAVVEVM
jgi:hypothetical protein